MATKTTRQGQLFPGAHDVPLRQALSGALPGLLHHLDHWFAMRYFPLQKEDSLHPEQSYTALDQLYQQAIREVRSALTRVAKSLDTGPSLHLRGHAERYLVS